MTRRALTLAFFACFTLTVVDAADGCGWFGWRCGDTCIKRSATCICGNTEIYATDDQTGSENLQYCCAEKSCIQEGDQAIAKFTLGSPTLGANCSDGEVLNLSEPCLSPLLPACNHYPHSQEAPSPRSYVPCVSKVPRQNVTNQCIEKAGEEDDVYHCYNRGDENPFLRPNKTNILDLSILLRECTDRHGSPGFTCPTFDAFDETPITCLETSQWCNHASPYTCGIGDKIWGADLKGIKVTDPRICGNFKFWENQECAVGLAQMQHRCTGSYPGQCVYNDLDKKEQFCIDGSDKNAPAPDMGRTCPKEGQLRCLSKMKFWDVRISEKNSKIPSEYEYAYEYPASVTEGSPAEGSGLTNVNLPDYVYDYKEEPVAAPVLKHKFICIEEPSMCDGTPQCEYGEDEDEEICAERKRDGHQLQDANFACSFPTYIIPKGIKMTESDEESFLDVSTTDAIRAEIDLSNETTFWRLSTMYAIRCDGEPQCIFGEDERDCLIIKETLKYAVPLILLLLVILTLSSNGILKRVFGRGEDITDIRSEVLQTNFRLKILTSSDKLKIKSIINEENLPESVLMLQHLDLQRDLRRKHNKMFFECLKETKGGRGLAKIWLKQNIKHSVCMQILADYDFSGTRLQNFFDLLEDKVKVVLDYVKNAWAKVNQVYFWVNPAMIRRIYAVWSVYGALLKDATVLASFFYLLDDRLWDGSFPSTLAWLLFVSIAIPLLFCAFETAYYRPLVIFGCSSWQRHMASQPNKMQLRVIQAFIIVCALFLPAFLASAIEEARDKKERLLEKSKQQFLESEDGSTLNNLDVKLRSINRYIVETNLAMLAFRKEVLSTENSIQLVLQVTMLMLSPQFTESPTHSGLQAVFDRGVDVDDLQKKAKSFDMTLEDNEVGGGLATFFLTFSIAWSLKDSAFLYLKVKFIEKRGFLPGKAKAGLAIRSLLAISTRLFCIVFGFFGPFLGLLNILAHWTAERKQTRFYNGGPSVLEYQDPRTKKMNTVNFSDIYRNGTLEADGYIVYTGIRLGHAFGVFVGLILLQMLVMFFVKIRMSPRFRTSNWPTMLKHLFESVNRPDYFVDWDRGGGNLVEHNRRWLMVLAETSAMVCIHFVFNLLLLVPLWVTATNVRERHLTIKPVIGVFQEETDAFELITKLAWLLPFLLTFFSSLELVMVYVYQRYLHPWGCIFDVEDLDEANKEFTKSQDSVDKRVSVGSSA